MEVQMGEGIFELANPEDRGAQAVLEIQVDGGGGGKRTVPSVMGVWIFSGITQCCEEPTDFLAFFPSN